MAAVLRPPDGTVNYQGQLYAVASILRAPPPAHEGDRFVPFAIDWAADTTAGVRSIAIDLTRGGVQPISQIAALWVDNSGSNADVQFLFLASQTRVTVPAQASEMVPVSTNDVRFTVVAPTAGAGDITFGQIFNFVPPPVALAETLFAAPAIVTAVAIPNASTVTTPIVPVGTSGVIRALDLNFTNALSAGANQDNVQLFGDNGTTLLFDKIFFMPAGVLIANYTLVSLSGLAIPFKNGLLLSQATIGAPTSGVLTVNVYKD